MKSKLLRCMFPLMIVLMYLFTVPSTAAETVGLNVVKKTIAIDETYIIKLTGTTSNISTIKWSSSDTKIVTVDKSGKISGKAKGEASVFAKTNDKTYECKVTVKTFRIVTATTKLKVGESLQLSVKGKIYGKTPVWSSFDSDYAVVSKKGLVIAKKPGTVKVSCKIDKTKVELTLTIKEKQVAKPKNETKVNGTEAKKIKNTIAYGLLNQYKVPITNDMKTKIYPGSNIRTFTNVTGIPLDEVYDDPDSILYVYKTSDNEKSSQYSLFLLDNGFEIENVFMDENIGLIFSHTSKQQTILTSSAVNDEVWVIIPKPIKYADAKYYPGTTIRTFTDVTGIPLLAYSTNLMETHIFSYTSSAADKAYEYISYLKDIGLEVKKEESYDGDDTLISLHGNGHYISISIIPDYYFRILVD